MNKVTVWQDVDGGIAIQYEDKYYPFSVASYNTFDIQAIGRRLIVDESFYCLYEYSEGELSNPIIHEIEI